MKKLFVFLLLSLAIFSCSNDDDNDLKGGDINVLEQITDPNFKECIRTFIEKGKITTSSPDVLTTKEAAAVELLHVYRWKIKDLKGIEYFTGLKELDCSHNELSSLDLSNNTKLEKLSCNSCALTSLNLKKNKELLELQCWKNTLTSLEISDCTKLTKLDCNNNKLTKLDLSNKKNLTYLDCCDCEIAGTMDVSSCGSLSILRTSHNPITSIKLNTDILRVTCVLNNLSELDLSKCPKLTYIMCTRNPKMTSLDITNNRNLAYVDCGGVSSEPPITLYVWWDVPTDNMWGNLPPKITIGVGYGGKLVTKK